MHCYTGRPGNRIVACYWPPRVWLWLLALLPRQPAVIQVPPPFLIDPVCHQALLARDTRTTLGVHYHWLNALNISVLWPRLAKTSCLQILQCDPFIPQPYTTVPLPIHLHRQMPQPISTPRPSRQPPRHHIHLQQLMRQPRRLQLRILNPRNNADTSSLGALRRYFICRLSGKHTNVWQ